MAQNILSGKGSHKKLECILDTLKVKKFLLVCDSSFEYLEIKDYFANLNISFSVFNSFTPNPLYEDVCSGVEQFKSEKCDCIVAVGGGSSIDVAKCIKLFSKMESGKNYLLEEFTDTAIPLIAIPTTAGTGSESTRYAVIYYDGKKQSVTHSSIVPDFAILEPNLLKTLPIYQKKCTLLDAFCQAIESWWSVNSTQESRNYAKMALELIVKYKDDYISQNSMDALEHIMLASNYAGRAINISQTTAAHAMSYKITSLYKLPHGHAVAVCLPVIWQFMLENPQLCIDKRGEAYVMEIFSQIAAALGAKTPAVAIELFKTILNNYEINNPKSINKAQDLILLSESVNTQRLGNNPIELSKEVLFELYNSIIEGN